MNLEDINVRLKAEKEAMANCETIPIHDIGYIQSCGALIAIDVDTEVIVTASENVLEWIDTDQSEILGLKFTDLLTPEIVHQCNNALAHSTIETQREYIGSLESKKKNSEIYGHVRKNRLILEFQPKDQSSGTNLETLDRVHRIISRLGQMKEEEPLLEQVVVELRAISGFHRVKAYRFLSDGAGEVVAESREPNIDSFLGLRFPAFDIPESARRLYESTPIRIIPSVSSEQVNLKSIDQEQDALDMSLALFRGLVPVHMIYLKNMGVEASLSLPITVNGKMWGLFAFHHYNERMLDSARLAALELLGGSISLILNTIIHLQRTKNMEECNRVASELFVPDESALGFSSYWATANSSLATLINCDGVALLSKDRYDTYGSCLDSGQLEKLCDYLDTLYENTSTDNRPIGIDSLESIIPFQDFGDLAGVLVIPKPGKSYDYLFYFRKDASKVVRWAGEPSKNVSTSDEGIRLNPRASFAEYQDSKIKTSDAFSNEDLAVAELLRNALSRVLATITVQSQHRERLGLVIRELNHRVRNMLALIGSIITQSKGSSHNVEEFVKTLELRLLALSETQKLLTEYDWQQVDIHVLFDHALIPYHDFLGNQLVIKGPSISLFPGLASLLALIMNELASNASKYGALSDSNGRVELTWNYKSKMLNIRWEESNGPKVMKPTRHGFGTTLIKEALEYEFNAICALDFHPEGVQANFKIPLETGEVVVGSKIKPVRVEPRKVGSFVALILEDDYIISKEMESHLKDLGAIRVDAVPSIEAAKNCLLKSDYDIAFLDANIRGEFSIGIANILEEKGIPFAFATGFGSKDQELKNTACIEVLSKPVSKAHLYSVLKLVNLHT